MSHTFKLGDRVLVLKEKEFSNFKPWYEGDVTAVSDSSVRVSQPLRWFGKLKWRLVNGGGVRVEKVKE